MADDVQLLSIFQCCKTANRQMQWPIAKDSRRTSNCLLFVNLLFKLPQLRWPVY